MHKYSMWSQFRVGHTYTYRCALNARTCTCARTGCLHDKFAFQVFIQYRKQRMRSVHFLRFCDVTLHNDSPRRCCRAENLSFVGRPGFVRRSPTFLLITRSQNFSLYEQTNWMFLDILRLWILKKTDLFTQFLSWLNDAVSAVMNETLTIW